MATAEEYIIQQGTKSAGEMLKLLDQMREEIAKVNFERIAEKAPESLTSFVEGFTKMEKNMQMSMLLPLMAAVLSEDHEQ